MIQVASLILENKKGEVLLLLRDDKAGLAYPNMWDLIGGMVEKGESVEEALLREVKEEVGHDLKDYTFFKKYDVVEEDGSLSTKFVFYSRTEKLLEEFLLGDEGQKLQFFSFRNALKLKLASSHKDILKDYIALRH